MNQKIINFSKRFKNKVFLITLFTTIIALAFIVAIVLIFVFLFINKDYQTATNLIKFLCWPGLIFIIFVVIINSAYLRELFSYLFLSMEELNFFFAKGKIENVHKVIKKKVEEGIQESEKNKQIEIYKKGIIELREKIGSVEQNAKQHQNKVKYWEDLSKQQDKLIELQKKMIDAQQKARTDVYQRLKDTLSKNHHIKSEYT